jgi:hypothetical protein
MFESELQSLGVYDFLGSLCVYKLEPKVTRPHDVIQVPRIQAKVS